MKKPLSRMSLSRETLYRLDPASLNGARGGTSMSANCTFLTTRYQLEPQQPPVKTNSCAEPDPWFLVPLVVASLLICPG